MNNEIFSNEIGIFIEDSSYNNTITNNNIYNNTAYAINATDNNGYTVDARNNWFGHPSGPYHPVNNTDGKGDKVTDYVLFDPWLGKPDGYPTITPDISITPNPALVGEEVTFTASVDKDISMERYLWMDGTTELYNGTKNTFTSGTLSTGTHTITLKVLDSLDIWSEEVTEELIVHEKPTAEIVSILPDSPVEGEEVTFTCSGTDDGTITVYLWTSSIDVELYNGSETTFKISTLSNSTHTIFLKVQDNYGVWSEEVSTPLVVNGKPKAKIESITPNPVLEGKEVTFTGSGTDDGSVERYLWMSGTEELYNGTETTFKLSNLASGAHEIKLRVQDNQGAWSDEVTVSLEVKPDADGDGVTDSEDAFPDDVAASKDTDGDGHPDVWNEGKTEADSTTGLKLDGYPDDPDKWEKEEEPEGDDDDGFIPGFGVMMVVGALLVGLGLSARKQRRKNPAE